MIDPGALGTLLIGLDHVRTRTTAPGPTARLPPAVRQTPSARGLAARSVPHVVDPRRLAEAIEPRRDRRPTSAREAPASPSGVRPRG